jgi:hypothetical protein
VKTAESSAAVRGSADRIGAVMEEATTAAQPWTPEAEELIEVARYGELEEAQALLAAHKGADFVNHRNEWGQSGAKRSSANPAQPHNTHTTHDITHDYITTVCGTTQECTLQPFRMRAPMVTHRLLLACLGLVHDPTTQTPRSGAVLFDYIVSSGALSVVDHGDQGNAPIHWACLMGHLEVVKV